MNLLRLVRLDRESRERRTFDRVKPMIISALQEECIKCAKWNYAKAKDALQNANEAAALWWLGKCIWYVMLAHFREPTDCLSGYSNDLTLPDMAAKIEGARYKVLQPKLLEILRCEDRDDRATLTGEMSYILMSLMDPTGFPIRTDILCDVLQARQLTSFEDDEQRETMGAFLEPLGFKPRHAVENEKEYTSWYWPSEAA